MFDPDPGARQLVRVMSARRVSVVLLLAAGSLAGASAPGSIARADDERALTTLEDVHAACRDAEAYPARDLLTVEVQPGWSFGALDEDGFLAIRARRSFRAVGARVELFAAHMETLGIVATPERAATLETERERGARLRLGFFIGFDEPDRTACLLRSRHAVTTVRMDVAYVELVARDGTVLAREDSDRYRAWRDDRERQDVPGSGPRAALGEATTPSGAAPEAWQQALTTAAQGAVGRALAQCHRDGVARGAEETARVIVRLRVDGRTGRVTESTPAISNLGDSDEGTCVAAALRGVTLSPGPGEWGGRTIDLDVPVRLAAD